MQTKWRLWLFPIEIYFQRHMSVLATCAYMRSNEYICRSFWSQWLALIHTLEYAVGCDSRPLEIEATPDKPAVCLSIWLHKNKDLPFNVAIGMSFRCFNIGNGICKYDEAGCKLARVVLLQRHKVNDYGSLLMQHRYEPD